MSKTKIVIEIFTDGEMCCDPEPGGSCCEWCDCGQYCMHFGKDLTSHYERLNECMLAEKAYRELETQIKDLKEVVKRG